MERRELLSATLTALPVVATSGCVARPPGKTSRDASSGNRSRNASVGDGEATESGDGTATEFTDAAGTESGDAPTIADGSGPTRGESDADVSVRTVENDESVEYLAEDDAVRYVAAWRHTNREEMRNGEPPEREPVYETTPFADWAETQCLTAAARAAADHAAEELGTDELGSGVTSTVEGEDLAAVVSVTTTLDRDGDVVSETDVSFDALVAATPASVEATYRLADRERTVDAPVYARYRVLQQE